jgi:hypothetical protein
LFVVGAASEDSNETNIGLIVGVSVPCGIVIIVIIAIIVLFIYRRHYRE